VLDAGLAIPLPPSDVDKLRAMGISILYHDFKRTGEIIYSMAVDTTRCIDPEGFQNSLASVFRDVRKEVWEDGCVQVSSAALECFRLVREYHVGLNTFATWVLCAMLSVEGAARQMHPSVDCCKAASGSIITISSLFRQLDVQSVGTLGKMIANVVCDSVGLDYFSLAQKHNEQWVEWSQARLAKNALTKGPVTPAILPA
jgi:predicted unusual protein kinase regulating ubiquinone biosynthesis (AarF/ABC1/UbiB family)